MAQQEGMQPQARAPSRRLWWRIGSLLFAFVFVLAVARVPSWIREYRAASYIRSFPDAIQPFAESLERSSCLVEAAVNHAWFKSKEPMPQQLQGADPIESWTQTGFEAFAKEADARLKDVSGMPVIMIQSTVGRMRDAEAQLKDSETQLQHAIASRDAGEHEVALAQFMAAKRSADAALSSAQWPLMHLGGTCPDIE